MIFELFNENCFKATCATDTSASTNQLKLTRSLRENTKCLSHNSYIGRCKRVSIASERERT